MQRSNYISSRSTKIILQVDSDPTGYASIADRESFMLGSQGGFEIEEDDENAVDAACLTTIMMPKALAGKIHEFYEVLSKEILYKVYMT